MHPIRKLSLICLFFIHLDAHGGPTEDFAALLEESWEWQLAENPVRASRLGDRRFNEQWADMNPTSLAHWHEIVFEFMTVECIFDLTSKKIVIKRIGCR